MRIEDYPLALTVKDISQIMRVNIHKAYDIVRRPDFPKLHDGNRIIINRDAFYEWFKGPAMSNQQSG